MINDTILNLIDAYGYFLFFLAFCLGPFGIPVPNEVTIVTGSILSVNGILNPFLTYVSILSGLLIAVTISYTTGRIFGGYFGSKLQENRHFLKTRLLLHKHGKWAICIGFFIPVVRYLMPLLVGLSRVNARTFIVLSYSSAIFWTAAFFGAGSIAGNYF